MLKFVGSTAVLVGSVLCQAQGGLLGAMQARKNRPPAPNMSIQLVGEQWYIPPQPPAIMFFLVLPDGAHATATCFIPQVQGMKPCGVEAFAAEKRETHSCVAPNGSQASCFAEEFYKANRTGNDLVVYSGNGASYMNIVGKWETLPVETVPKAFAPSRPTWTAICNDDSISYSAERSGTCSDHHGVKVWRTP